MMRKTQNFFFINIASAATAPTTVLNSASKVVNLFCVALIWMFWALLVLSVAMFFVGGYKYATSSGEPEKTESARKTLLYAAIGVAVAICARGVPLVVGSFFGVDAASLTAC